MASLAEIRAKLKSQEVNRSTSNTGGDNAIYPHWNISEGSEAVVRFLPDKDTNNTFFWTERNMIKLPFAGSLYFYCWCVRVIFHHHLCRTCVVWVYVSTNDMDLYVYLD